MPWNVRADGVDAAVGFVRALRRAGVWVPLTGSETFVEAIAELDISRRASWYWAGRTSLVSRHADIEIFDRVFDQCFDSGRSDDAADRTPSDEPEEELIRSLAPHPADDDPCPPDAELERAAWSATEVLSDRDLAAYSDEELAEAQALMTRLVDWGPTRRTRRRVRSHQRRGPIDQRRAVREAVGNDREILSLPRRRRAQGHRRVVLILDVSGSMDAYSRAYLRFAHAAVAARPRVEAFSIGTRLTRLTRSLRWHDPDLAIAGLLPEVHDWSGGTRLGEALHAFNADWGVRGLARGAVVVVFSDGWERGRVDLLEEEMARLHRVAHRVVWVNPLKATPGYEPLARGMAAALAWVDHFVEGHSIRSLAELASMIATVNDDRRSDRHHGFVA